jgi:hypothetical protein
MMKTLILLAAALIAATAVQAKGMVDCAKLDAAVKATQDATAAYLSAVVGAAMAVEGVQGDTARRISKWIGNPNAKAAAAYDRGMITEAQLREVARAFALAIADVLKAQDAALAAAGCPIPKN